MKSPAQRGMNSSTSADLHGLALELMLAAGFPFVELKTNSGTKWHRDRKQSAFWYTADEGISSKGNAWLQVSAGDYRETGGENKATFVF